MQSTWRSVILAIAVSMAIAAAALFFIFRYIIPGNKGKDTNDPLYVIGDWQGKVAVFEEDQPYPRQVFDVYVSTLPEPEQQKLRAGIPAEDDTQLSLLLEDYTD